MKVLCLLLATIAPVLANPLTPDQAALEFLDAVRAGKVKTAPNGGTALSVHTNPEKLQRIGRLLERMANDLGSQPLRVGQVKTDDDLAAVMVWKDEGNDPSHMQVFPVAMVKRGEQWLPAPVPGSFENCGVGLHLESRKRMEALEDWMLTQRTLDLAKLRNLCIERMRERITNQIPRSAVAGMSRRQVLERYLNACRNRNADELLGLLGGFSDPLPDYWAELVLSLQKATNSKEPSPWQLLMADGVLRVELDIDEEPLLVPDAQGKPMPQQTDEQLITLACLDTEEGVLGKDGLPVIHLIHLQITKADDGLWRIQPPRFFWESQDDRWGAADPTLDKQELNAFAAAVRKAYPPRATSNLDDAAKSLTEALEGKRFENVLPLLKIDTEPERGLSAILHAAQLWNTLHGESSSANTASSQLLLPLDRMTKDQLAAISCQLYSTRKPDRFTNTLLHLVRDQSSWSWLADPDATQIEQFEAWQTEHSKDWQQKWRDLLVHDVPVLEAVPTSTTPTEAQCRELMNIWFKAMKDGDIRQAISCCTMLKLQDSPTVFLRNLGYEITANLRDAASLRFEKYLSDPNWAAACIVQSGGGSESYPMYPIVATPKGPRILLEIDLIAGGDRGRQYLNQTSINRLRNFDAATAASLQKLFADHQQARANPKKTKP